MFLIAPQSFGKTVFCGTAPNAIFLTTDPEGTISARQMGSDAEEWRIQNWTDLNNAYRWLRDEGIQSEGYKWLIIDNITEAQRMGMWESMVITKRNSNAPSKLDEWVPTQADYQRSQNMILKFALQINDLPINVIYTSHIKGMEDEEGEPVFSAAIHGQKGALSNQIVGYSNITAMGELIPGKNPGDDEVRRFWFSAHGAYRGKDRFVALGRYQDNLTVPKMMEIIGNRKPVARKSSAAPSPAPAATSTRRPIPPKRRAVSAKA
jgi:hypothetical protein